MVEKKQITAVILAGGKGRRFHGNDKGLLIFKQRPLIEHLLAAISPHVAQILINANRNQAIYAHYNHPVISDEMSDFQGPLAGFSVAMSQATTPYIITLPCDAPFMNATYIKRMANVFKPQSAQLAVAHDGKRLQPVHALIPVALKASLDEYLNAGNRATHHWYTQHKIAKVDFSDHPKLFKNINTKEQLAALEANIND